MLVDLNKLHEALNYIRAVNRAPLSSLQIQAHPDAAPLPPTQTMLEESTFMGLNNTDIIRLNFLPGD